MSNTDLHYLGVKEIARMIRAREISPVEVTARLLARIEKLDESLHSYALVMREQALAQAQEAERQLLSGGPIGPLHGVPIAVKDLYWVAGFPTAAGTTIHKNFIPSTDSTAVRRLREAGAILLGKLQLTEGAFATHHPSIPDPVNPWHPNHWSGASSSGSGVATAAGLCYASLGTDTGGSIRFPAAANGLTGIKPTWGCVSRYGVFELGASLDHPGPIARNAVDAALLLGIIAGNDPLDPTTLPETRLDLPESGHDLRGLKIGIDHAWNSRGTDDVIVRALEQVVNTVKNLGGEIQEICFPEVRTVVDEWQVNCGVEVAVAHADTYPRLASEYGPALTRLIELGRDTSGMRYQEVLLKRAALRGKVTKLMSDIDLLIVPVQPFAAPTHEQLGALAQDPELNARLIQYTAPFNSSGHPTITLPCGFTEGGMPIGFQFVAQHGAEALLCRAGMAFQQATHWHQQNPGL
ncbi:Asp-tRNA(Asn)/Glu-tRNA(Gln) amidotransferase GatCAB subunit A [Paraburkholderia sp. 1N]|uniref:Asp-tRNA(Asn)/Glu-tRNA(Gln) amidotransferase GatCAB subunit A n=1 Tax=Paraburkholderia solitsugae TaxID=2675748 RepID=A0ABX2BJI6_9BURK|nr:amidase [Paraburkholderia solitsugae]NPT40315.1 Asp-tRNA(Asn)/Glu-tRNA(Gln) amidotransferase GatCAB subunit A [Paraburkholderia solitsugae]